MSLKAQILRSKFLRRGGAAGVIREKLREISLPSQYRYRERRTGLHP